MAACLLPFPTWTARVEHHERLVAPWANAFIKRREHGLKHPVHDFLFTYYNCSPLKLKQWVPSFEEALSVQDDVVEKYPWLTTDWFTRDQNSLCLNIKKTPPTIPSLLSFISQLCKNISERPPRFKCFGLHEWAMVYKASAESIRHQGYRLRLSPEQLAHFVESQNICCSHYDAYRFFTEEARPLNVLNPQLETRLQMEQGGCVHANMDLYKWSVKLWPWIGSDFIAKTFLLALEGRELDMRASPYDLSEAGYAPICIETEEGRLFYQAEQKRFTERASYLRLELSSFCDRFFKTI